MAKNSEANQQMFLRLAAHQAQDHLTHHYMTGEDSPLLQAIATTTSAFLQKSLLANLQHRKHHLAVVWFCTCTHREQKLQHLCSSEPPALRSPPTPYLMGLISALLQPNVSQPIELLQGHEVHAALNASLVYLRGLRGRREMSEAAQAHHRAPAAALPSSIEMSRALRSSAGQC